MLGNKVFQCASLSNDKSVFLLDARCRPSLHRQQQTFLQKLLCVYPFGKWTCKLHPITLHRLSRLTGRTWQDLSIGTNARCCGGPWLRTRTSATKDTIPVVSCKATRFKWIWWFSVDHVYCIAVFPEFFLIANHLSVPVLSRRTTLFQESKCAKYNSIKFEKPELIQIQHEQNGWQVITAIFRNNKGSKLHKNSGIY